MSFHGKFYDVFSSRECEETMDTVESLSEHWEPHGQILFTLGSPVYQNSANISNYYYKARRYNELLWQNFRRQYERVLEVLSEYLQKEVFFYKTVSLPGFHIFVLENSAYQGGGLHFDLPHQSLVWSERPRILPRTITFTLAIKLPVCGAGINLWNLSYEEVLAKGIQFKDMDVLKDSLESVHQPYQTGKMAIFEGNYLHCISAVPFTSKREERVTLQGHLINVNGSWMAYW